VALSGNLLPGRPFLNRLLGGPCASDSSSMSPTLAATDRRLWRSLSIATFNSKAASLPCSEFCFKVRTALR
jgi:hypothetical protein